MMLQLLQEHISGANANVSLLSLLMVYKTTE